MVARERGVCFREEVDLDERDSFVWPSAYIVADDAMSDVAAWLGFDDVDEYLKAIEVEKETIFDRATY